MRRRRDARESPRPPTARPGWRGRAPGLGDGPRTPHGAGLTSGDPGTRRCPSAPPPALRPPARPARAPRENQSSPFRTEPRGVPGSAMRSGGNRTAARSRTRQTRRAASSMRRAGAPLRSALIRSPRFLSRRRRGRADPPGGPRTGIDSCAHGSASCPRPARVLPREACSLSSGPLRARTALKSEPSPSVPIGDLGALGASPGLTWERGREGRRRLGGPWSVTARNPRPLRAPRSRAPPCRPRAERPLRGRPGRPTRAVTPGRGPAGSPRHSAGSAAARKSRSRLPLAGPGEPRAWELPGLRSLRGSRLQTSRPRCPARAGQGAGAGPAPKVLARACPPGVHTGRAAWAGVLVSPQFSV